MGRTKRLRPAAVDFGKRVRSRRRKLGLSQIEFAELCGYHFTYVSDVENGKRNITMETMLRFVEALNAKPEEMVKGLKADRSP